MIGIIAVLIGILVPALSKARDASLRTKCLSNLRQLGTALQIYSITYHGRVPIGYWGGQKQSNFMIHVNENDGWVHASFYLMLGLLYHEKLMESPQSLFCPAEPLARYQFNTPENPWPPVEPLVGSGIENTRCGYGTRPTDNWNESGAWPEQMPLLSQLKSRALLADLAPTPYFVDRRHKTGINVYYADGSARWVNRSAFDKQIASIPNIGLDSVNNPLSPDYNDKMLHDDPNNWNDLWHQLDHQ